MIRTGPALPAEIVDAVMPAKAVLLPPTIEGMLIPVHVWVKQEEPGHEPPAVTSNRFSVTLLPSYVIVTEYVSPVVVFGVFVGEFSGTGEVLILLTGL